MNSFEVDGITFQQRIGPPAERGVSDGDSFVLVKTDQMLDFYRGLAAHAPQRIMEIGMYEGGSLVWYDKLYRPTKLVGLDLRREPIPALEAYRASRPHIVTCYGRHQDQQGTLTAARKNFPDGIDLVVDDASHLYAQTRATFLMLFPLLRPGGHYVIEDWTWAHRPAYQRPDALWADQPAMSNLVLELVIAASQRNAIHSIHIDRGLVCVRRGPGAAGADLLDLSDCLRGRKMPKL